jgi:hypothetical protein
MAYIAAEQGTRVLLRRGSFECGKALWPMYQALLHRTRLASVAAA